jgi:diguanylate cyclase (GGDEF)-like protein
VTSLQEELVGTLVVLALMVLTVPKAYLGTPWFIGLLTLGDSGVLFIAALKNPSADPWMLCELVFLLAMASYVPSFLQFGILSSLVVSGYGLILHQSGLLQTDAALFLPALLCLALVFLSKIGIFQAEIQRMAETHERSLHASMNDALTGLPNRAQFIERVERIIQYRHINRNFHFAVLFIDLDGFKPINDKLGHEAGDALLRQIARLLQGCLRKGDLVGRYVGDEFTALINNVTDPSDVIRVAECVLSTIQTPIHVGETVQVGASIGIALSTNASDRAEDLIRDADAAMYRAKAQGRNRFVFSDQCSHLPDQALRQQWEPVAHSPR